MQNVNKIREISNKDISRMANNTSSWHTDFQHSAYIIITNLDLSVQEGDLSRIFSQYGEITDIHIVN